jgi:hypothetical protein
MNDAASMGRLLMVFGVVLLVIGALLTVLGRMPRLPGDILIRRDTVVIYIPLVTSLLLSVLLTLVFSLFTRH